MTLLPARAEFYRTDPARPLLTSLVRVLPVDVGDVGIEMRPQHDERGLMTTVDISVIALAA